MEKKLDGIKEYIFSSKISSCLFLIGVFFIISLLLFGIYKIIKNGYIKNLSVGKSTLNFTNAEKLKEIEKSSGKSTGESDEFQSIRLTLLKQYLYTIEFCKSFHTVLYRFCKIAYDECQHSEHYPNLNHLQESLEMYKEFSRERTLRKIINWNDPLSSSEGIPTEYYFNKLYSSNPPYGMDYRRNKKLEEKIESDRNLKQTYEDLTIAKNHIIGLFKKDSESLYLKEENSKRYYKIPQEKINISVETINNIFEDLREKKQHFDEDYSPKDKEFLADLADTFSTCLRFWDNKVPRILDEETNILIKKIEETLLEYWLRNDIPLTLVQLDNYVNTHATNLRSIIGQSARTIFPEYKIIWFEQALYDTYGNKNIDEFMEKSLRDYVRGLQIVRFNKNIFEIREN